MVLGPFCNTDFLKSVLFREIRKEMEGHADGNK